MTGQELVNYLRENVIGDVAIPFLWPDTELLRYLNYGEVQACRRASLIIDSSTSNDSGTAASASTMGQKPLCSFTTVANQATYNLSPKILQIKRCQLKSMTYPLIGPITYAEVDDFISGWWGTAGTVATAGSGGVPYYFLNEPGNTVTFIPAPSEAVTIYLVVSRIPLISFTLSTSPEIDEKYHVGLCDWAAHLAYLKRDPETLDLNMAKVYEDKFVSQFGLLPDAYSERMRKTLNMKQRMRSRPFGS